MHVEVRSQGDSYDELLQKFQAGLASKQLPAIALVEDQNLRVMVDTGAVLPAESCQRADKSDFPVLPAVRNYYTIDDVFWPGYVDVSEPVLYYNVNHFKKAGLDSTKPPLTLDELEKTARDPEGEGRLQQAAARPQDGLVVHRVRGSTAPGATVVNKNNGRDGIADKATFDNPVTHEVYEWINEMLDEGLAQAIPDTPGNIDQYLALAQQNSSMTLETSTAATTIKAFLSGDCERGRHRRRLRRPVGPRALGRPLPGRRGARQGAHQRRRLLHDQHGRPRGAGGRLGVHEVHADDRRPGRLAPDRLLPADHPGGQPRTPGSRASGRTTWPARC